jgi:uncharacterized 2Fe-2S/4Fe-4S cluster protein (DUF4445 family)
MIEQFEIIFQPDGRRIKVPKGLSILEAANEAGVDITSICGGMGTCGKCKVIIESQADILDIDEYIANLEESERKFLTEEEIRGNFRLACRYKIDQNLTVRIPIESRTGKQRLQVEGVITEVKIVPNIRKHHIILEKASLDDTTSDFDRLTQYLESKYGLSGLKINFNLLKSIGPIIRNADWDFTAVIWNDQEIISLEQGNTEDKLYGYAVDIGTTKLAAYLLNLKNGEVLAVGSLMNPQIPFGEDVISRINYDDPQKLQNVIIDGLNEIFEDTIQKANIYSKNVYDLSVVGNTTMLYLFLGIDANQIGVAPYVPAFTSGLNTNNEHLGILMNDHSKIYTLPVFSGYVGADTMGVILATEIYKSEDLCMALDIGTNTEVILGNKDRILTCSCASGPAFEGAHIEFGMRASSGAIEKVKIDPKTLDPEIKTIDDIPARGICGSAIVDIPAEMLKTKIISVHGRMNNELDNPRLRQGEKFYEYILVWAKDSLLNKDIIINQKDIREIILAKAAMHTGTEILMHEYGIKEDRIDKLYIAGAFGTHIDLENARLIGLYPEIPISKIQAVGNAAGTGARMCLVSKEMRNISEEVRKKVEYIELGAHPNFQNVYLNSNYIPFADLNRYPKASALLKEIGNYPKRKLHVF